VLDRDHAPPKGDTAPSISANVYCGQTVGWIKMKLGMEVGLGPGHIVLDGDSAPLPQKGHSNPPNFWPMYLVAKRLNRSRCYLIYGGRPRPRRHCVRWGPPPKRGGAQQPRTFRPMSIVANGRPSQLLLSTCNNKSSAVLLRRSTVPEQSGPKSGGLLCPFP